MIDYFILIITGIGLVEKFWLIQFSYSFCLGGGFFFHGVLLWFQYLIRDHLVMIVQSDLYIFNLW